MARNKINNYLNNFILSIELEKGIFEYSLISSKKLQPHYCQKIYLYTLYNICENLDQENKIIDNQTLCPAILNYNINPTIIPFLNPQQIHPKRWLNVMEKISREDQARTAIATYEDHENKCENCGGFKFHSYEQQLRSADEPANKFVICIDCGYTVIY